MNIEKEYSGQQVLITGGLGFIGSNLARKLVEIGSQVTIIDNLDSDSGANLCNVEEIKNQIEIIQSDISNEKELTSVLKDKKYLFNLAGQNSHVGSMQDPYKDLTVNADSQLKILEVCRLYNPEIKIVFAGTRQVYGRAKYLPVDEKHLITPLDNNGVSKRAGEMYHIVYNRVYDMHTCVLRMTNVYGPRMRIKDDKLTFVGWWIRQLLEGQAIQIYGDGSQIRDFNYVDDVIDAMLLCVSNPFAYGKIYNLGGEPITLLELARLMIEIFDDGNYELIPYPSARKRIDIGDYHGDYSFINLELGWQPQTSLQVGIKKTIEFYKQHKQNYF
ncbi:MAG: NAD-dependent epimerase/dehydratase family protein [Anaerolineales bacterium]|nr:NAD-dependent epimerase/dehydratase family protein [Anaerolineales bacterium]